MKRNVCNETNRTLNRTEPNRSRHGRDGARVIVCVRACVYCVAYHGNVSERDERLECTECQAAANIRLGFVCREARGCVLSASRTRATWSRVVSVSLACALLRWQRKCRKRCERARTNVLCASVLLLLSIACRRSERARVFV